MTKLRDEALACTQCAHLVSTRTQVVFGVGTVHAELMLIGEAPGLDEDKEGEPFVGAAGQLLTKIIEATGLDRDKVYIANILKCRPDTPGKVYGNRKPRPEEMETCFSWGKRQIEIIQPRVMVALGGTAVEGLLGMLAALGPLRVLVGAALGGARRGPRRAHGGAPARLAECRRHRRRDFGD